VLRGFHLDRPEGAPKKNMAPDNKNLTDLRAKKSLPEKKKGKRQRLTG
jgi:hypothetical protein